ncbi:MAG: hypothetical protein RBR86_02310 [Pseudobdellovibrionaceae bacterium]|jgi:hypothetical protein|nr:hypothetical protein [Pseudobdellovibrionaceae bacterium]
MKNKWLAILLTLAMFTVSASAWAQDPNLSNLRTSKPLFNAQAGKYLTSNILPILKDETLTSTPGNKIPDATVEKIYDQCKSKVPSKFTTDSLEYYCSCSAAATSAAMSMSELQELQKRENWKLGNAAFEKYVHEVVMQCIDVPIDDMEYMSCIMNRGNDWRVERIPLYCKCLSKSLKEYALKNGEAEMMLEWGTPGKRYASPIDALYNSTTYQYNKNEFSNNCISHYKDKDPLGRY